MGRKLSQIPAVSLTDTITNNSGNPLKIRVGRSWVYANSLKALDALSDDGVSNSPSYPSGTTYYDEDGIARKAVDNGLLAKTCSACNKTPLGQECDVCGAISIETPSPQAKPMYTEASVRNTIAGIPHPLVNHREWLESICGDDNIVPATARQVNNGEFWCRECDRSIRVCPHYRQDTVRLTTAQFTRTTHDIKRSGNAKLINA